MLNSTAGPQAVAIFEHAVQAPIFQLMQLQLYGGQSLTEAFKAAEKVADILGKVWRLWASSCGNVKHSSFFSFS